MSMRGAGDAEEDALLLTRLGETACHRRLTSTRPLFGVPDKVNLRECCQQIITTLLFLSIQYTHGQRLDMPVGTGATSTPHGETEAETDYNPAAAPPGHPGQEGVRPSPLRCCLLQDSAWSELGVPGGSHGESSPVSALSQLTAPLEGLCASPGPPLRCALSSPPSRGSQGPGKTRTFGSTEVLNVSTTSAPCPLSNPQTPGRTLNQTRNKILSKQSK